MEDVLHAILFVILAGGFFVSLMIIEAYYYYREGQSDIYDFKETVVNLTTGAMYKITDGICIALYIGAFYDLVSSIGLQWFPEVTLATLAITFIALDFFQYFNHRITHKVRWLWTVHHSHHSSNRFNLSTALRQNLLFPITGGWLLWWLPIALIGYDKFSVIIMMEIITAYQFFLHTTKINKLGPLEKLFNTPSHHRVHHGKNTKQIDRNFGAVFIIWDKIFGTFRSEDDAGEIIYGVTTPPAKPLNPLYLQLHEFFLMLKETWQHKDLRILFMSPDWLEKKLNRKAILQDNIMHIDDKASLQ